VSPRPELNVSLRLALQPLVARRQELIAERDRLIEEIGTLSDDISRELALADEKSLRVGPYLVTLVESAGRLTLDKHRLVELGVSPDVITEASVRGKPSISLQVRTAAED
jgi:hypothetical protein